MLDTDMLIGAKFIAGTETKEKVLNPNSNPASHLDKHEGSTGYEFCWLSSNYFST